MRQQETASIVPEDFDKFKKELPEDWGVLRTGHRSRMNDNAGRQVWVGYDGKPYRELWFHRLNGGGQYLYLMPTPNKSKYRERSDTIPVTWAELGTWFPKWARHDPPSMDF